MKRAFKTFIKTESGDYVYKYHEPVHIIYGDTDSSYIDLSGKFSDDANPEEVISFSDNLGVLVNEQFPEFLMDVFNIPKENTPIVQTEREVVSDRSFFMKKKKYAMHVINKEGVPVDEVKIMGMETKKSSTQPKVREFLSKLVGMIMRKKTYDEIKEEIDIFKEEFDKLGMMDIGVPTTLNSLTKYESAVDKQDEEQMKKIPYHGRASLFYNSLCGPSDIKVRTGDKIKVVYIKHPNSSYVAIPSDAAELPKFLDDLIIDREMHWEKVTNLIEIYLESAGLDKQTRQKQMHEHIGVQF